MLAISSTDDVLRAVRSARDIALVAYTLRPGRVEDALVAAAHRGARVTVRLEGHPRHDPDGSILADNQAAVDALTHAGAQAHLSQRALHAKAVLADGALYLDDRNWPDDGEDTILHDTFANDARIVRDAVREVGDRHDSCFAITKREALAFEARLLNGAAHDGDVIVESESFGDRNAVYKALAALGDAGAAPRVLVSARDLQDNARERAAILRLKAHGVGVRAVDADEKFAFAGARGWIGSTNATAAFDRPDQLDWGMRTNDASLAAALRARFEARWTRASEITAE